MFVHSTEDTLYVYGGYSKEKAAGSKKEGKVHEDMWMMKMKPMLTSSGGGGASSSTVGGAAPSASAKSLAHLVDVSKGAWERISRKGEYPSTRCGAVITMVRLTLYL